jgi:hypothetical protein
MHLQDHQNTQVERIFTDFLWRTSLKQTAAAKKGYVNRGRLKKKIAGVVGT